MLAVRAILPDAPSRQPPVVLVHGAANSAVVWTHWQPMLGERGVASYALDLRGHGAADHVDLSRASMRDYADDVRSLIAQLAAPPVVIGWSMGGLVAMMVAADGGVAGCVGLAPSRPSDVTDESKPLRQGTFGPEGYGIASGDPENQPAMPDLDREERLIALSSLGRESRYARDERARGVAIASLPCPLLIATGTDDVLWPRGRYDRVHLPADHISADGATHWGLALNRRALVTLVPKVLGWIELLSAR